MINLISVPEISHLPCLFLTIRQLNNCLTILCRVLLQMSFHKNVLNQSEISLLNLHNFHHMAFQLFSEIIVSIKTKRVIYLRTIHKIWCNSVKTMNIEYVFQNQHNKSNILWEGGWITREIKDCLVRFIEDIRWSSDTVTWQRTKVATVVFKDTLLISYTFSTIEW